MSRRFVAVDAEDLDFVLRLAAREHPEVAELGVYRCGRGCCLAIFSAESGQAMAAALARAAEGAHDRPQRGTFYAIRTQNRWPATIAPLLLH